MIFDHNLLSFRENNFYRKNKDNYNSLNKYIADILIEDLLFYIKDKNNLNILELSFKSDYIYRKIKEIYPDKKINYYITSNIIKIKYSKNIILSNQKDIYNQSNHYDIIISNLDLHYINDIDDYLNKIYSILKKNGLFLASLFGYNSLFDIKKYMQIIELKLFNRSSPHIASFFQLKDITNIAYKIKFISVITGKENLKLQYKNIFDFFHELKDMMQFNILYRRNKKYLGKEFFIKLNELFLKENKNKDYNILFEILTLNLIK